jgi:hypothetical protein
MWAESVVDPYDAVVFFECFHHCADHMRLLRALRKAVKPEGCVYFGAEPITDAFPMPWGLRLDGESLWAVRKQGWLELGFTETYFQEALSSAGWDVVKYASGDHFSANVWEARRLEGVEVMVDATEPSIGSSIGIRTDRGITVEAGANGWAFYGPYSRLPAGKWIATARLSNELLPTGKGVVEVCAGMETTVVATAPVDLTQLDGWEVQVSFELSKATKNVEMRFFCTEGVSFTLQSIGFQRGQSAST